MSISIFKIVGIIGLVCIIIGILLRNRRERDYLYIVGGIALTLYSFYIDDIVFIILQVIFTVVALYDLIKGYVKKN